jgi:membrane-bound lytic murein transglycosylase A
VEKFKNIGGLLLWMGMVLLASCAVWQPRPAGVGAEIPWEKLPGWRDDNQAEAWPALLRSCRKLRERDAAWREICLDAQWMYTPDVARARAFFERHFRPHPLFGAGGEAQGLITGYYEPLLQGSLTRTERFRYPLYRRPPDLLTVDLGALYPELQGRPVRGRLQGNRVVPYFSRAEITAGTDVLAGQELLWVDDAVALFMLQVQGSGRVAMPDGSMLAVGYADQNGHAYFPIGRRLVAMGALKPGEVTLYSIRDWLHAHPEAAEDVLNHNPSYIFFALRDASLDGPLGSLNVPLVAQRSIAVDAALIPLGLPVWLDTTLPGSGAPYRRLMQAQDTGGAIKGQVRADVFFGRGAEAERLAGEMKQSGRLYVLLPQALRPAEAAIAAH